MPPWREDPLQYEPEMERKSSPVMLAECLRYGPRAEKAHQLLHPLMLGSDLILDDVHFMDRTSTVALQ